MSSNDSFRRTTRPSDTHTAEPVPVVEDGYDPWRFIWTGTLFEGFAPEPPPVDNGPWPPVFQGIGGTGNPANHWTGPGSNFSEIVLSHGFDLELDPEGSPIIPNGHWQMSAWLGVQFGSLLGGDKPMPGGKGFSAQFYTGRDHAYLPLNGVPMVSRTDGFENSAVVFTATASALWLVEGFSPCYTTFEATNRTTIDASDLRLEVTGVRLDRPE